MRAQGYVVLPEGPLDSLYSEKAIQKEIDPALLSVHLFGSKYDAFAERQVRLSMGTRKRLLLWIPKSALETAEPRQRELLESLRNAEGIEQSFSLIEDSAVRSMITEVMRALKPSQEKRRRRSGEPPEVYLVCDASAAEDYDFAGDFGKRFSNGNLSGFCCRSKCRQAESR